MDSSLVDGPDAGAPRGESIEVEDRTDEGVMHEHLAAMHARQWVLQRRALGLLPD
jgi:hypothetical protein